MGFLESLEEKAADELKGQVAPGSLAEEVLGLLMNKETGGLSGLIESFNQQGLGHIISSWVGKGDNAAITPEQVQAVLGSDAVKQLAGKFGIPIDTAREQLAALLPGLIDKATPEGNIPEGGSLQ